MKMETMKLMNYSTAKQACKDFGVYFENLVRPCPFMFELPNGEIVSLGLTNSIHIQIENRQPELTPEIPYTLRDICGDAYWHKLNETQQEMAHDCVVYLIDHQDLPMICIASATGRQYQLSK